MHPSSPVTLSNENGHNRFRPSQDSPPAISVRQRRAHATGWRIPRPTEGGLIALRERSP
jgi:hypothetical protein